MNAAGFGLNRVITFFFLSLMDIPHSLMRRLLPLLAAGLLPFFLSFAQGALDISPLDPQQQIAPIPDAHGLAGMAAAAVTEQGRPVVLAAGGAHFPDAPPWQGGSKIFRDDLYVCRDGQWSRAGGLPRPIAYAAFAPTARGMVIAGGCDADTHSRDVWLVQSDGACRVLPQLPVTVAYASFAVVNNRLYVIGGQQTPASTTALRTVFYLDLTDPDSAQGWQTAVDGQSRPSMIPGEGRMLATAGVLNGRIYLVGGCSLAPGTGADAVRTYLDEVLVFDPARGEWSDAAAALPTPLAGAVSPAPAREGTLMVIGGDDGSRYGMPPADHPGQSRSILLYEPKRQVWERSTLELDQGIATAPGVVLDESVYIISGETRPGIRTERVQGFSLSYKLTLYPLDWMMFGLTLLLLLILCIQVVKKGKKGIGALAAPDSKPGFYAWVVVALLWVVALLNYFDRQLLTTIREPVMADIPQTETQFGLLTAVFLFIYSALSPVGGFLADRFSRRIVILASLTVWSAVTWWTGHVGSYGELFLARALMGISEACYIPAALALITDYHRGSTRSLATGIHMSGVYAGMAIAGYGGALAEMEGWRLTFGLFGLIGVCYALVLIFALKDTPRSGNGQDAPPATSMPAGAEPRLSFSVAVRHLFGRRAFWLLLGVMAGAGAVNWLVLGWFPTMLKERFHLGLGDAGIHATLWNTLAKYAAVIVGALIADQWSKRNVRARQLLPALIFLAAGPAVGATAFLGNFSILDGMVTGFGVFVACMACQGLAQGVLDATLMPVLRSHIDERFSATGYGFLNLVSAGFGGLTVLFGGRLKDMGIDLTKVFAVSSVLMLFCGLSLLLMPKPAKEKS